MLSSHLVRFRAIVFLIPFTCGCGVDSNEKTEVLIYYANETAPDGAESANYTRIIEWFRSSSDQGVREVSNLLERDLEVFHVEVDEEIAAIRRALLAAGSAPSVVVFTNRSVRNEKFFVGRSGEQTWSEERIEPVHFENYILANNPLSTPEMLERVLLEVARRFDTRENDFILITKSHGNHRTALTPRLSVCNEETKRDEVLAVTTGALPDSDLPEWAKRCAGVSKETYFDILGEAGQKHGMEFSLVVMESCMSGLGAKRGRPYLPANVDCVLATLSETCDGYNFDYANILEKHASERKRLSQVITEVKPENFGQITHPHYPYYVVLYFFPLMLLAALCLLRRFRAKRTAALAIQLAPRRHILSTWRSNHGLMTSP